MACPTCDHTMQNLNGGIEPWFWCPRCGTVSQAPIEHNHDPPALVNRVVELLGSGSITPEQMELAERLGIGESIRIGDGT